MPKKLLIINVLLSLIAAGSTVFIVRQLTAPMPMPLASRRPAATAPAAGAEEPPPSPGNSAYVAVAARNLFSPTRTEAPSTAVAGVAASLPKPNLYGIVLREGAPIAYLEDPSTKRVAGYRIGDNVAGGTVQTIGADGVVLTRPEGKIDVRLRDPARPRPAAAPAAAVMPGAQPLQPAAGQAALPGVIPPAAGAAVAPPPGQVMPQPGVIPPPGQAAQPVMPSVIPGRRPLPPNLLRRLPQGAPPDASQQ
ncbi:MAG TPA: hypothetical protein VFV05_10105 [Methylomirabilota bacterium]|nr:hypothetical protein [Methylomirabilota bacterium]